MTISVLVPAYNEAEGLAASLASIRVAMGAFTARGWATELVVCDNNSTDGTPAIAAAAGARVVFEPVNQIARARNAAAAAAMGDWLVFVDADSHPPAALFADTAAAIATGRVLAGGSVVQMERAGWLGSALVGAWNLLSRVTRWAAGAYIFVDATAFRHVGGFSQRLYASEEIDLFRRLKRQARREASARGDSAPAPDPDQRPQDAALFLARDGCLHAAHCADRRTHVAAGRGLLRLVRRPALTPRRPSVPLVTPTSRSPRLAWIATVRRRTVVT